MEKLVDAVEDMGENGLDEDIDARDMLRFPGVGGRSGYIPAAEGARLAVPLIVRSASSTFVELFHVGFPLRTVLESTFWACGEVSGVRL